MLSSAVTGTDLLRRRGQGLDSGARRANACRAREVAGAASIAMSAAGGPQNKTYQFKLVLLGDSAVGKSSLVLRFVKGQFFEYQESTIGGTRSSYVPGRASRFNFDHLQPHS